MKHLLGSFVLLASVVVAAAAAPATPPNIVVILADDLGYGSVGCYGADPAYARTPAIDRLAREGRRFTDANTPSSVCTPTRYALLTGRYCWRTSLQHGTLSTTAPLLIEPDRATLPKRLRERGYATAAIGKWHLGYGLGPDAIDFQRELRPGPLEVGFDYHFGVPSNHGDASGIYVENRWVYGLTAPNPPSAAPLAGPSEGDPAFAASYKAYQERNVMEIPAPRRVDERVTETLTDRAIGWLERRDRAKPFFLYFTPVAVHNPVTPDQRWRGSSRAGKFGEWIHELDASVGRLLEALDRLDLASNTLVLFTSDNGGVHNLAQADTPQSAAIRAGFTPNGSWRGGKQSYFEGGFRVPFIARWPGRIPANTTSHERIGIVDFYATAMALLGGPQMDPTNEAGDSFDVSAALLGREHRSPLRPAPLVKHSGAGVFAILEGDWKWIEGVPARGERETRDARPKLFNLAADPQEEHDLVGRERDVAQRLKETLLRIRARGHSR